MPCREIDPPDAGTERAVRGWGQIPAKETAFPARSGGGDICTAPSEAIEDHLSAELGRAMALPEPENETWVFKSPAS